MFNHNTLTRTVLASLALTTAAVLAPLSATAAEATFMPADMNHDGFVSRKEHVNYAGVSWDKYHGEMRKMDPTMKADMMDGNQYRGYNDSIRLPDGRVDPGKVGGK